MGQNDWANLYSGTETLFVFLLSTNCPSYLQVLNP